MNIQYTAEYKALTPSQRAKVRKLIKAHDESILPLQQAMHKHENAVRAQAWQDLQCSERIEAIESEFHPQMQALEEQRKALWEQYQELSKKVEDLRGNIRVEPYQAVYADPQYKAMRAIISQSREQHEAKLAELMQSFKESEVA